LSILSVLKTGKHNVSESGCVSSLRWVGRHLLCGSHGIVRNLKNLLNVGALMSYNPTGLCDLLHG
jgi:hypothetical protein